MEHPKDPYHVRPFPKQPSGKGKALKTALIDLESSLGESLPNIEALHSIQARIHEAANTYNDDRLVNMIRILSLDLDQYKEHPDKDILQKMLKQILKIQIELKHL